MPFGFDGPLWQLMGLGIDWMIAVALWVARLPGAVGRGAGLRHRRCCSSATAGIILMCLLRTPLRWSGAVLMAARDPVGDRNAEAGRTGRRRRPGFAVRGRGRAARHYEGGQRRVRHPRSGLAADADARTEKDPTLRNGFTCDEAGCIARLKDGTLVSVALARRKRSWRTAPAPRWF